MSKRLLIAGLLVCASQVASAQDSAEYRRVVAEMNQLASRNAWSGVERQFQALRGLGEPIAVSDWLTGAQAARTTGDITLVQGRLVSAQLAGSNEDVDAWLGEIEAAYGSVSLMCDPGATPLTIDPMPFQPDRLAAVEYAQQRIQQTGTYEGLLPEGDYELGIMPVEVIPGLPTVMLDVRNEARGGMIPGGVGRSGEGGIGDDWGLPFLPGQSGGPTTFGIKLGIGTTVGLLGAGFTVRPVPQWSFGIGAGLDPLSGTVSGAFDVRYRLPDPRFWAGGQFGPMQWRGTWNTGGKAFYGPSAAVGYELTTPGFLVDIGVGAGFGYNNNRKKVVPGAQFIVAVGTNFGAVK